MSPTPALVRAVSIGVGTVLLAVLVGRPELMLLGAPLLVWALVAACWRLLHADATRPDSPRIRRGVRAIEEGGSTAITVTAAPELLLSVSVPLTAHADLFPRFGSATARHEVPLRVTATRWGMVKVGPVHTVVADPLGAHRRQHRLEPVTVQVVPSAPVLDAPTEVPTPIGVSGMHLSRRRGEGTALSEVREFRPGDRLHRINWRVTSRTGTLHTNATFTEQDTDVLLVTDTIADVPPAPWAAEDAPSSLDMTIRATAAIARHYLIAGDRVAVFDLGSLIGPVRAGTGPRQLRVLTEVLSRARRADGQLRPARTLRTVRPGTLVVMCSPLLSDLAIEQIGLLRVQGADVIVVDTLPPSIGDLSMLRGSPVRDGGSGPDRFWPEAWALRRMLREETVQELTEQGVPVTAWEGPASLAPVLLSLSVARSAPRRRRG